MKQTEQTERQTPQTPQTPLWKREHPRADVPDIITNDPELVDVSWHNDIAPSFITKTQQDSDADWSDRQDIRLWVQPANPADREFEEIPRFSVSWDGDTVPLFESETDADGAVACLKARVAKTTEKLSDIAKVLSSDGLRASWEYPGFVLVLDPAGRGEYSFGTASGTTWGGDLCDAGGNCLAAFDLAIPATSGDVDAIADAIRKVIGPVRLSDADICDAVTRGLLAKGIHAESMNTGGGIFCVFVPFDDTTEWVIGTGDVNWGGALGIKGECDLAEPVQMIETNVPSDSQDIDAIVDALVAAIQGPRS